MIINIKTIDNGWIVFMVANVAGYGPISREIAFTDRETLMQFLDKSISNHIKIQKEPEDK